MKKEVMEAVDIYENSLSGDVSKILEARNLLSKRMMDYQVDKKLLIKEELGRIAWTLYKETDH